MLTNNFCFSRLCLAQGLTQLVTIRERDILVLQKSCYKNITSIYRVVTTLK